MELKLAVYPAHNLPPQPNLLQNLQTRSTLLQRLPSKPPLQQNLPTEPTQLQNLSPEPNLLQNLQTRSTQLQNLPPKPTLHQNLQPQPTLSQNPQLDPTLSQNPQSESTHATPMLVKREQLDDTTPLRGGSPRGSPTPQGGLRGSSWPPSPREMTPSYGGGGTPLNGYPSPTMSSQHSNYDSCLSPNSKIGREDLSPPSSLNGYGGGGGPGGGSMDPSELAKKKKGPVPRQQEELCLVCGDRASGYHYNALTCEGCKGFFRRSITKNAVYQCKYGNNCEIDMYMRRKCQECRLKKCLSVGMRPECVVPEYQCAVKRKEKRDMKDKTRPNSTTSRSPEALKIEPESQRMCDFSVELESGNTLGASSNTGGLGAGPPSVGGSLSPPLTAGGVKPVSSEQEELIHRLVYFQNEFEHPSEEDLKRIGCLNLPSQVAQDQQAESDMRFRHITEITILTVQLIVEFAKRLPGFDKLLREDQIVLLKACSSEVMMLRTARKYDVNTDSILFANNQPYTRDSYTLAGMGYVVEDLLQFCRHMYRMKVDNAEYALLTAIVIFSDRPSLLEAWKVEKIQEIYLEALKSYVDNRIRPKSSPIFAKLLSVLTELRTLGNQNSQMCFSLKLKNKKLPDFLMEIWDVDMEKEKENEKKKAAAENNNSMSSSTS